MVDDDAVDDEDDDAADDAGGGLQRLLFTRRLSPGLLTLQVRAYICNKDRQAEH